MNNRLTSPILEKQKISTDIKEITLSNILRLLNTNNYEIYGMPTIGVGLKKILFSIGYDTLEDYKNIIINYLEKEIPYMKIIELTLIPFYYNEKGEQIIDFNNYDSVAFEIKYEVDNEVNTFFNVVSNI